MQSSQDAIETDLVFVLLPSKTPQWLSVNQVAVVIPMRAGVPPFVAYVESGSVVDTLSWLCDRSLSLSHHRAYGSVALHFRSVVLRNSN
jgi:hypothetical protein